MILIMTSVVLSKSSGRALDNQPLLGNSENALRIENCARMSSRMVEICSEEFDPILAEIGTRRW